MPSDILGLIFDFRTKTSRPGTEAEKGTGFGLPLVKMFFDAYQATIDVTSTEAPDVNQGTSVQIAFNKA